MTVLSAKANSIRSSGRFHPVGFEFAHQADPDAELYYNDYSMAKRKTRRRYTNGKKPSITGVKIDGIGMQGHMTMDFPAVADFEESVLAFADLEESDDYRIRSFGIASPKEMPEPIFHWIIHTIKI